MDISSKKSAKAKPPSLWEEKDRSCKYLLKFNLAGKYCPLNRERLEINLVFSNSLQMVVKVRVCFLMWSISFLNYQLFCLICKGNMSSCCFFFLADFFFPSKPETSIHSVVSSVRDTISWQVLTIKCHSIMFISLFALGNYEQELLY